MNGQTPHPLDRPIWSSLTTGLRHLAVGDEAVVRFRPDVNILGAAVDQSAESLSLLAELVPVGDLLGTVESEPWPVPPGMVVEKQAELVQMVLSNLSPGGKAVDWQDLDDSDAAEMLVLATLTEPGPFLANTHLLGGFVGIKAEARLVAMAGERMKVPGFTEVSGVCTHSDHRGRGYAAALMRVVIGRILERGEQAFLHSYASNAGAIGLYESLGFRTRSTVTFTTMKRQD